MNSLQTRISWFCQLIAGPILITVGFLKLSGHAVDVELFSQLGMEPEGRLLIGLIELLSGLMLLSEGFSALGSFLSVGVMCGAIIAHCTHLGIEVGDDGGLHIVFLAVVLFSSLTVMICPIGKKNWNINVKTAKRCVTTVRS